jgi:hypothetical protein
MLRITSPESQMMQHNCTQSCLVKKQSENQSKEVMLAQCVFVCAHTCSAVQSPSSSGSCVSWLLSSHSLRSSRMFPISGGSTLSLLLYSHLCGVQWQQQQSQYGQQRRREQQQQHEDTYIYHTNPSCTPNILHAYESSGPAT